ncbi:hypothetical protein CAEBREN_02130 [Caenorhabditis brenneri]|uniref:NTF2-like domain-containing protein n=1 Tax=Caenorhabditis brenneri TaxID=135651 RepID=G0P785_CAEBE|nr:hypothetical protein CAEBREN_02130 [Caenorhabditis brenneri]
MMFSKIFILIASAVAFNDVPYKCDEFSVCENRECSILCPESSAFLRVYSTLENLNTEIQRRSNDIGNHIHDKFKYTASGQTVMDKRGFLSSLKKLPKEQHLFIKCKNISYTKESLTCNAMFYGSNYGNVSAVLIRFHPDFQKVLEFMED